MSGRVGRRLAVAVAAAAFVAGGCSSGDERPPAESSAFAQAQEAQAQAAAGLRALSGTWAGEWKGGASEGTVRFTWQQFGRAMKGTVIITGGQCLDAGPILGRVNGSVIDFDIESTDAEVIYRAEVVGNTMTGTYTTSCANGQGTWRANKV